MTRRTSTRSLAAAPSRAALGGLLLAAALAGGCAAPLLMGGAVVGTALTITDRRTSGAQLEDQAIELKALSRVSEAIGDRGHVNVTSYNRSALITGEVANEADREAVGAAVARIDNVRATLNELTIVGASSLASRANDGVITSRVKAAFIDARDVHANAIKVLTERAVVYLMGIATEREAARAAELARGISGVAKVVKVFEIISEAELARIEPPPKDTGKSGDADAKK